MALTRVNGDSIANGTVIAADIADGSVTGPKLGTASVSGNNIGTGAISANNFAGGGITSNVLASNLSISEGFISTLIGVKAFKGAMPNVGVIVIPCIGLGSNI